MKVNLSTFPKDSMNVMLYEAWRRDFEASLREKLEEHVNYHDGTSDYTSGRIIELLKEILGDE